MTDDVLGLSKLGSKTNYVYDEPSSEILEVFKNKYVGRDYTVEFVCPEFTSLCPKTGQPDFGVIRIKYVPKDFCIESKSLKLYLFAFRQYKSFMETIVNKIRDDLVLVCQPKELVVEGDFNARGGIVIKVASAFRSE